MLRTISFLLPVTLASLLVTASATEVPWDSRNTLDPSYTGPTSVATGDLDADGLSDIVAASLMGTTISWWKSLGNGSFTKYDIATGVTDINHVEVADINGDGHLDVLVTSSLDTDAVGWFENDGTPTTGAWPLRLIAINFNGAICTAAGDFDGDGTLDVAAIASTANTVSIAYNTNGTGIGWSYETVSAAFASPYQIAAGDVDKDGDLDIGVASSSSGELSWWSNDGSGWTKHSITATGSLHMIRWVDMDRDGDLDALGAALTGAATWWENNGSGGGWTERTVGDPDGEIHSVSPVDLDLDGDLDILFASYGGGSVGWFEDVDGDAKNWQARVVDSELGFANDASAGDFDNDGDPDIAGIAFDDSDVVAWENLSIHRNATFPESATVTDSLISVRDLVANDLDGDGDIDLLVADSSSELVVWLENASNDGTSWTFNTVGTFFAAKAVAAGDLNGDGRTDVVGASDDSLKWWLAGAGGAWAENTIPVSRVSMKALAVADLDGDGDLDVVLGSNGDGVHWFENSGSGGSWTEGFITNWFIWDSDSMVVYDIDRDGDPDVAASENGKVQWISNDLNDTGLFRGEVTVADDLSNTRSIDVGDIDGDGDIDIAAVEEGTDTVWWWPNTSGDGTTWGTGTTVITGVSDPRVVRLVDLDLDGDLDLALAAQDQGDDQSLIAWYENTDGDGSHWTEHQIIDGVFRPLTLLAADLDGDGDPDVAYNTDGSNADPWWENRGGQASLSAVTTAPVTQVTPMEIEDVLKITALHRGRTVDTDGEVAGIDLFLDDGSGTALTGAQADALLYGIYVFEDDDDSGDFDPAFDSEVWSAMTFALVDGVLTVDLVDGDTHLLITPPLGRTLFVALVFETDAAEQAPGQVQITFRPASSSVEDWENDIPLSLEWAEETSSGIVIPTNPNLIFADGFESGDTSAW